MATNKITGRGSAPASRKSMNLRDMVVACLDADRQDGMVNTDIDCWCDLDTLMSCMAPLEECRGGYMNSKKKMVPGKRRVRSSGKGDVK